MGSEVGVQCSLLSLILSFINTIMENTILFFKLNYTSLLEASVLIFYILTSYQFQFLSQLAVQLN